jgi:hypothetical protein
MIQTLETVKDNGQQVDRGESKMIRYHNGPECVVLDTCFAVTNKKVYLALEGMGGRLVALK